MKAIPSVSGLPPEIKRPMEAIKESIEEIRGERRGKIATLASDATLADCINKINELLTRIQG